MRFVASRKAKSVWWKGDVATKKCRFDVGGAKKGISLNLISNLKLNAICCIKKSQVDVVEGKRGYERRRSLKTILQSIKKLGPALLTVVEQDANLNGQLFLGRFLESLHYYSAIFDSLEASLGRNSIERMKIKRDYFAEEIRNIVACRGPNRVERHERADQWRRQLARVGFQVVARMDRQPTEIKSLSGDGYTVENDQKESVFLGWKGRPVLLAAWQLSSCLSPPSPTDHCTQTNKLTH
ncbi:hypothetical protein E3N88_34910 [Mikania micrantha]|uniref:Uncharacterized protein n=1 Tax=Mikania micrantha TaxID=192012 RepID=A0A5N6LZH4_9ASTR|nr:hypothetical protein E3N88_34910 [Mikania micrantha]